MDVKPELSASHMEDDKKQGKNYIAYEKELILEIAKSQCNIYTICGGQSLMRTANSALFTRPEPYPAATSTVD
ncbi:hypothetical protein PoB_006669700 [Plakobranchus ocellatus]|uniref:Uncharacterized protein n=1 Tax=Plakobranchus ocellatus TaxID=259542 RepID=A0AAV4D7Y2_9GAST|nr:hypothetical protein PoB_006669700 [Plakobranchus ocellatus]